MKIRTNRVLGAAYVGVLLVAIAVAWYEVHLGLLAQALAVTIAAFVGMVVATREALNAPSAEVIAESVDVGLADGHSPLPLGEGSGEGGRATRRELAANPHPRPLPKGEGDDRSFLGSIVVPSAIGAGPLAGFLVSARLVSTSELTT